MDHRFARRLAAMLGVLALVVGACNTGGGGGAADKEVTVVGTWGGSEQESFLAMVKPWEDRTGNKVKYTGSRGLGTYLTTAVQSGTLPDLAGLPGPGEMSEFAKGGSLKPLDDVLDIATYKAETSPAFVTLGTVDGKVVGVFIKSALKGLIWYNPKNFTGTAPATWDAVMGTDPGSADSLWCVGLESGADSGWPGTDWVEDFVLRQSGPDVYDNWVAGKLTWSAPEIKSAYEAFGDVLDASFGGAATVNSTNFGAAGNPLFTDPPGCLFHHQASFITDFFKEQGGAADGDFDFFPMPDINPQYAGAFTGAGDLFGLFSDKAAAKDLLKYLVTAEAQQIWVSRGGALSGNTKVTSYPDDVSKRSAEILGTAKIFRFDGGDLMPNAMKAAFFRSMVDFAENQGNLDSILAGLDEVQKTAYAQ
ncbi:MAG TPA: extracellular solute-binding protein [Candidatus Limnocylindrales bacterium]|jgi:alpha-glucoside transport system substrate-binding protein|nr:extracellular solute-binding protein [Candidatus Limnocylindrales bacterium]